MDKNSIEMICDKNGLKYGKNMTKIDLFDKNDKNIGQKYDKSMTKIWQKYGRNGT